MGGWWRWVADQSGWSGAQLDGQCVCLWYLPLHHKVQKKISSGTGSPGLFQKKGRKMVVCVYNNYKNKQYYLWQETQLFHSFLFSVLECSDTHGWMTGRRYSQEKNHCTNPEVLLWISWRRPDGEPADPVSPGKRTLNGNSNNSSSSKYKHAIQSITKGYLSHIFSSFSVANNITCINMFMLCFCLGSVWHTKLYAWQLSCSHYIFSSHAANDTVTLYNYKDTSTVV